MCGCNSKVASYLSSGTSVSRTAPAKSCYGRYSTFQQLEQKAIMLHNKFRSNQDYYKTRMLVREWISKMRIECPDDEVFNNNKTFIEDEYAKHF